MPRKTVLLFTLLTLVACLLSYQLGSAPSVLAKSHVTAQDAAANVPPPLPAPPAEWVVFDYASGTAATTTKAGAAGVQHVADCISFSGVVTGNSPSALTATVELLDGSTIIMRWDPGLPTRAAGNAQVNMCGLNVVGTVGNSMTLEFTSGTSGNSLTLENVNLVGHDAT